MLGFKQIRAIDSVANMRSFRLAAEALHTTQPTLSRLIAKAEAKLGVSIFRRGWSGTETTAEGDIVSQYCRSIIVALNACERKMFEEGSKHPSLSRNIRMHQLETIDAIVRTGGVSAAAINLGCSQPAISRSLSSFVSFFGVDVFRRTHGGMTSLEAADDLSSLYGVVRNQLEQIPLQLSKTRNEIVGRVAIGMLPFSGQELISKAFSELTNLHPKVRLVCVPGSYDGLVDALRRREIERIIGIVRGDYIRPGLRERVLYHEKFTIVARRDHELHGKVATIEDLKTVNWIVAPQGTPVRTYFDNLFSETGHVPPVQTCEMWSFNAAEQMLVESNSLALLSYSDAKLASLRPELKSIEIDLPNASVAIGLTHLQTVEQDPAIEIFDDILSAVIRENV